MRYAFDTTLAHGPTALIGWLGVLVLVLILTAAIVGHFFLNEAGQEEGAGFFDNVWRNANRVLLFIFDADPGWSSRLLSMVTGLFGLLIGGALIGLIGAAISQRFDELAKGRSAVLETGHTLILGWSSRLPLIVQELVVANKNLARSAIVIIAPRPIADMEAEIRDRAGDTKTTKVVCRSGNPSNPSDLQLGHIAAARSVIVLAGDEGDAAVVKTILAVKILDPEFSNTRLVAEFTNPKNDESIRSLTDGAVTTVNSEEVIAQVTAQACHQPGLSQVFAELLDFAGDECYFVEVSALVGHTYGEALLAFKTSSVIGWRKADGLVQLNPPAGGVFEPGDEVIAISEDDDTVTFTGFQDLEVREPASPTGGHETPVRVLIVGWSTFGPRVVEELDEFLPPGSEIEVSVDPALVTAEEVRRARPDLPVSFGSSQADDLQALADGRSFDQVIVLGYAGALSPSDADSRTLLSLLALRKMWPLERTPRVRLIAQLLDQANVELAAVTGVDDFIVSDALTSLMLAQLSERRELQAVFDDLFDPAGAFMQLRPAHRIVPDATVSFAQIVAAGVRLGMSVIGWRVNATGDVVLNPAKDRQVHLGAEDQVLLIGDRTA